MLFKPNQLIITMISRRECSNFPDNVVPSIVFASLCLCGPATAGCIVCCCPFSATLPSPCSMRRVLLMRSVKQCITIGPGWRCGFVMGFSNTLLSPELMTTTASNLERRRRTTYTICPMKSKAWTSCLQVDMGPAGPTRRDSWRNKILMEKTVYCIYLNRDSSFIVRARRNTDIMKNTDSHGQENRVQTSRKCSVNCQKKQRYITKLSINSSADNSQRHLFCSVLTHANNTFCEIHSFFHLTIIQSLRCGSKKCQSKHGLCQEKSKRDILKIHLI